MNSSSNWSISSNSSQASSWTRRRTLRAIPRRSDPIVSAVPTTVSIATRDIASSSSSNGRAPGTIAVMNHWAEPATAPARRRGSSPALTTDDLPDPEGRRPSRSGRPHRLRANARRDDRRAGLGRRSHPRPLRRTDVDLCTGFATARRSRSRQRVHAAAPIRVTSTPSTAPRNSARNSSTDEKPIRRILGGCPIQHGTDASNGAGAHRSEDDSTGRKRIVQSVPQPFGLCSRVGKRARPRQGLEHRDRQAVHIRGWSGQAGASTVRARRRSVSRPTANRSPT